VTKSEERVKCLNQMVDITCLNERFEKSEIFRIKIYFKTNETFKKIGITIEIF